MEFPELVTIVPEGEHGIAKVDHFEITREESSFTSLRPGEYVAPGKYARLLINGHTWMSDTRMEKATNYAFIHHAKGDVLIAGLGLGLIIHPLLTSDRVKSITVIEKFADVIALIEPTVKHDKVTIINADIFTWRPKKGTKYDTLYFDIWADQCTSNLDEMSKLHQAFKHFKAEDGFMDSWYRDALKSQKRSEQYREGVRRFWRKRLLI